MYSLSVHCKKIKLLNNYYINYLRKKSRIQPVHKYQLICITYEYVTLESMQTFLISAYDVIYVLVRPSFLDHVINMSMNCVVYVYVTRYSLSATAFMHSYSLVGFKMNIEKFSFFLLIYYLLYSHCSSNDT